MSAEIDRTAKIRVALVDDHRLFREGLISLLSRDPSIEVVWEASSTREAEDAAKTARVDVVLMDVSMPGTSGIEATRTLVLADPALRVLILTMHAREEFVVQALLAGATGFALKMQKIGDVIEAIRAVSQGRLYLAPEIPRRSLDEYHRRIRKISKGALDVLTTRERQVFELAVQNRSNRDIARDLDITVKTVETHRTSVNKKLGVHSAAELVRFAAEHGLLHI
jgi:DNA-binding NarL/FixJ family response regulator